jgi:Flp pilus assembly protein TadG
LAAPTTLAKSCERGQSTVELALVLPFIVALLTAIVVVGLVVRDQLAVWHAAAASARSASIYPDEPLKAQMAAEEEVSIRPLFVTVSRDDYMITATVAAPRTVRWWLIGTTSTLFTLRASVTMHVQEVG